MDDNVLAVDAELDSIDAFSIDLLCDKEVLKGAWA